MAQSDLRDIQKNDRLYEKGDCLGIHNRPRGKFANGRYDQDPVYGMELISTLDIDLQEFGEKLMGKRKDSVLQSKLISMKID